MLTNIQGLVERLDLPASRGLMPLFEAVSNAIDAIQERTGQTGLTSGKIHIRLIERPDLLPTDDSDDVIVDGLVVTDDGAGFTDANLRAFQEAYTRSKVNVGGKGVGRFTFLKVFSAVSIESVFTRGGRRLKRSFQFSIDAEVSGADKVTASNEPTGTAVKMTGLADRYRIAWPRDPEVTARRLIAHFLIRFAARSCPTMMLEATRHKPIILHSLFQATVQPHIEERSFVVDQHTFSLQAFRNRDRRARHEYHLCANGREVTTGKLRDLLPELPERFVDASQQPYTLIVLVTGEYLDQHANQGRTA